MGVASPLWMHAIDTAGIRIAHTLPQPQTPVKGFEAATTPKADSAQPTSFVDPGLKSSALGEKAPQTNPGARY